MTSFPGGAVNYLSKRLKLELKRAGLGGGGGVSGLSLSPLRNPPPFFGSVLQPGLNPL